MNLKEFKGHPLLSIWRLRFQTWENESGDKRSKLTVLLETFQFLPRSGGSSGGPGGGAQSPDGDLDPF